MTGRGHGTSPDGSWNDASRVYKDDPRLETYVKLRREHPDVELDVAVIGGFESLFYMREEFARYGLDPELLVGILDAVPEAVSELALSVMEALVEARRREAAGETHLASRGETIPLKLVDWIICCTLDALSWNDDLRLSRDMIVLIRERLGGSNPLYEQVGHVRLMKSKASQIAGQLKAQGIAPTYTLVGGHLGVAASTVMRWFGPGEFERDAEVWSRLFDENGAPLPLTPRDAIAPDS